MTVQILTLLVNEDGATALEYGLLTALIAAVIISAVQVMGNSIGTTFNTISGNMSAAS